MKSSVSVAQRILQLCEEHSLTVSGLCEIAKVRQSTISDIVNEKTQNAGVATIEKLCKGLGISLREFFDCELFDA